MSTPHRALGITQRPLAVLGLPADLLETVNRLGFSTVGDLANYFRHRAASGVSVANGLVHAGLTDEAVEALYGRLTAYLTTEVDS